MGSAASTTHVDTLSVNNTCGSFAGKEHAAVECEDGDINIKIWSKAGCSGPPSMEKLKYFRGGDCHYDVDSQLYRKIWCWKKPPPKIDDGRIVLPSILHLLLVLMTCARMFNLQT